MSIQQETGEIVRTALDGFKGNPTCLAAVILAALFSILTFLSLRDEQNRMQDRFNAIVNLCWADNKAAPTTYPAIERGRGE